MRDAGHARPTRARGGHPIPARSSARPFAGPAAATPLALLLVLVLSSCEGGIGSYFTYEGRMDRASPPDTVEELKAAIAEYGAEVDEVVEKRRLVGVYQRMLANRYLQEGLYGPSYEAALEGLESFPQDVHLHYALAVSASWLAEVAALEQGEASARRMELLAVSERAWRRMLELEPRSTRALYGLAVLLDFELGRPDEALPLVDQLLSIETKNIDALFLRARLRYQVGDVEGAANDYEQIVRSSAREDRKAQAAENLRAIEESLYGTDGRP